MPPLAQRVLIWAAVTAGLLLIPYVTRMPWERFDYVVAGVLVFGAACLYEFTARLVPKKRWLIVAGVVFILFALTYVELAVGLFGTPFAGS